MSRSKKIVAFVWDFVIPFSTALLFFSEGDFLGFPYVGYVIGAALALLFGSNVDAWLSGKWPEEKYQL